MSDFKDKLKLLSKVTNIIPDKNIHKFKAYYIKDKWYGRMTNKKIFPVVIPAGIINSFEVRYSSPTNDYHPIGTPHFYTRLNKANYIETGYWTILRPNLMFEGVIVKDTIVINWQKHRNLLIKDYDAINNHSTTEKSSSS